MAYEDFRDLGYTPEGARKQMQKRSAEIAEQDEKRVRERRAFARFCGMTGGLLTPVE